MNKTEPTGYRASLYQIRFAYQLTFHEDIPAGVTYLEAGLLIRHKVGGFGKAKELIDSIPNDASLPYPLD